MSETEISIIKRINWVKIIIINIHEFVKLIPEDPKRESSRCPAIILAVSRIERVIGRIINLINSIITINGIKI